MEFGVYGFQEAYKLNEQKAMARDVRNDVKMAQELLPILVKGEKS